MNLDEYDDYELDEEQQSALDDILAGAPGLAGTVDRLRGGEREESAESIAAAKEAERVALENIRRRVAASQQQQAPQAPPSAQRPAPAANGYQPAGEPPQAEPPGQPGRMQQVVEPTPYQPAGTPPPALPPQQPGQPPPQPPSPAQQGVAAVTQANAAEQADDSAEPMDDLGEPLTTQTQTTRTREMTERTGPLARLQQQAPSQPSSTAFDRLAPGRQSVRMAPAGDPMTGDTSASLAPGGAPTESAPPASRMNMTRVAPDNGDSMRKRDEMDLAAAREQQSSRESVDRWGNLAVTLLTGGRRNLAPRTNNDEPVRRVNEDRERRDAGMAEREQSDPRSRTNQNLQASVIERYGQDALPAEQLRNLTVKDTQTLALLQQSAAGTERTRMEREEMTRQSNEGAQRAAAADAQRRWQEEQNRLAEEGRNARHAAGLAGRQQPGGGGGGARAATRAAEQAAEQAQIALRREEFERSLIAGGMSADQARSRAAAMDPDAQQRSLGVDSNAQMASLRSQTPGVNPVAQRRHSDALLRENIPESMRSLEDVESAASQASDMDVRIALGTLDSPFISGTAEWLGSGHGQLQTAIAGFQNEIIKSRSGATVVQNELQRIRSELGTSGASPRRALERGFARIRARLEAIRDTIDQGAGGADAPIARAARPDGATAAARPAQAAPQGVRMRRASDNRGATVPASAVEGLLANGWRRE